MEAIDWLDTVVNLTENACNDDANVEAFRGDLGYYTKDLARSRHL